MSVFDSDSYMGRSRGTVSPRSVYCAACRHGHLAPVAWAGGDPCSSRRSESDDGLVYRDHNHPPTWECDKRCPLHAEAAAFTDNQRHEEGR